MTDHLHMGWGVTMTKTTDAWGITVWQRGSGRTDAHVVAFELAPFGRVSAYRYHKVISSEAPPWVTGARLVLPRAHFQALYTAATRLTAHGKALPKDPAAQELFVTLIGDGTDCHRALALAKMIGDHP